MTKKIKILIPLILVSLSLFGCTGKQTLDENGNNIGVKVCDYKNIDLTQNKDKENTSEYIMQYLLDNTQYNDYSQEDIDKYIEDSKKYYEEYAALMGVDYETYIKDYVKQTPEDFEKEIKKSAINYVKEKDILSTIANKENIEFTNEDYDNYLNEMLQYTYYNSLDDFKNSIIEKDEVDEMKEVAYFDKILKYLEKENSK